jgi:hypothetical protein
MFRLERVIIRLFVEPHGRYINHSAYFGIPKKFTFTDTVKIITVLLSSCIIYIYSLN